MTAQTSEPSRFHAPLLPAFVDEALIDAIRRAPSIIRSRLRGANLRGAHLAEVNLSEADLREADLRGANLTEALLNEADLSGANLARAHLIEAVLVEVTLTEANLDHATLTGATLTGANLAGTYLKTAGLNDAHLEDVIWTPSTIWPESIALEVRARSDHRADGTFVIRREPPLHISTGPAQVAPGQPLPPILDVASPSQPPADATNSPTIGAHTRGGNRNRSRNRPGRPKPGAGGRQPPVDHRRQSW